MVWRTLLVSGLYMLRLLADNLDASSLSANFSATKHTVQSNVAKESVFYSLTWMAAQMACPT